MLKSAQFPFHSWLPDTLETPTPVSALMHAGIINAGGFLIVRLSPLVTQSTGALNTLALLGAFTALFASVIMMTQTSIKKSLAWSTVAQMGFMMLQCGLGAFALAMMHIVAHSLYKAHAFLSSGSVVNLSQSSWTPVGRPAAHPLVVIGSLAVSATVGFGIASLLGVSLQSDPGHILLIAVFIMAMSHLLWTLWSSSMRQRLILRGLGIVVASTAACFTLHAAFEHLLAPSLPTYAPLRSGVEYAVMILVALLFLAVLVFQSQLPAWASRPSFQRLYVHASNGFYLGTLFNRISRQFIA
jgi:NAD(P)H-quinone oxidoreductase subunit 5